MPRGVKGSGTPKTTKATKTVKAATPAKRAAQPVAEKTRKPYPSVEERIALADKTIDRLTKLNENRQVLVEKTESLLNERKDALVKSQDALTKAVAKKERLTAALNKPEKTAKPKLTKEELAVRRQEALVKARAARKAEKDKLDALKAALDKSGKSVDELLAELVK